MEIGGVNEKFFPGLVSLNSSVSCGFVCLCLISLSQSLVIGRKKCPIYFRNQILPKFLFLLYRIHLTIKGYHFSVKIYLFVIFIFKIKCYKKPNKFFY